VTTPTANPTARETKIVALFTDVTRALEERGHVVERAGFVIERVDGVDVHVGEELAFSGASVARIADLISTELALLARRSA
jgi:hypothetical protein